MPETSDLLEKSALIFLYNFHREHSWLKLIIKKLSPKINVKNIKNRVFFLFFLGVLYAWMNGFSTLLHNIAPGKYIVIKVEYGLQLHFKIFLNKSDRKKQQQKQSLKCSWFWTLKYFHCDL